MLIFHYPSVPRLRDALRGLLLPALVLLAACDPGPQPVAGSPPVGGGGKASAPLDPGAVEGLTANAAATRERAFAQLSEVTRPEIPTLILNALHHEFDDTLMRRLRGWLLGLSPERLSVQLDRMADTTHPDVRRMFAAALAGHAAPAMQARLVALAGDADRDVRRQVASVLAGRDAPAARAALTRLLEDEDAWVRVRAAEALGRTREGETDWRVLAAAAGPERARAKAPDDLRPELAPRFEGDPASEVDATVDRALLWLIRHQEENGSWDGWRTHRRGAGGLPEIGHVYRYIAPSLTGLAVVALLQAGVMPDDSRHGVALKRGLAYLMGRQHTGGMIGYSRNQVAEIRAQLGTETGDPKDLIHMFNHAIAAWALAEATAQTRDDDYELAAARAMWVFFRVRHDKYPWTRWMDPDDDIAYASYALLAMVVGDVAGLPVDPALIEGAQAYLRKVTQLGTGRVVHGGARAFCFGGRDSQASGLWMRRMVGLKLPDADARSRAYLLAHPPRWNGRFAEPPTLASMANDPGPITNFHYWHFGALALAGQPGLQAQAWRQALQSALTTHQRSAPWSEVGSWDPCGPWSRVGGRVYATASAVLALLAPRASQWSTREK